MSTKTLRVTLADINAPTGAGQSTATVTARYVDARYRGRDVHLVDGTIVVPVRRSAPGESSPQWFDFDVYANDAAPVRDVDYGFLVEVAWSVTSPEGGKSFGVRRVSIDDAAASTVQLGLLAEPTPIAPYTGGYVTPETFATIRAEIDAKPDDADITTAVAAETTARNIALATKATAEQGAKADTAVQPATLTAAVAAETTARTTAITTVTNYAKSPSAGRRGAKVIFVGDSHAQGAASSGTGSDWTTTKNYPVGASQLAWALWLSMSRLTFWGNYGIGGERTDQVYARRATYLSTGADLAIVQMGTNDSRQAYTLAFTQQYYTATVEALLGAGMDVILVGVPPCLDGQNGQDQRNAWIATYASRMRVPFVDSFSPVVDTATRAIATAYNGDGVHLNGLGAKVTGQRIADAIGRLYAPVEGLVAATNVDATNALGNALGLTDATSDGIPDGWSTLGAPTGGTVTHTLEPVAGWTGKAFCVEQAANTNSRQLYYNATAVSGKFAPGDRMRAAVRVKSTGALSEVQARVDFGGASGRTTARFLQCKSANIDDGLASLEFIVPAATTSVFFYLFTGSGTGKAYWGQPTLTNLTQLGITDGPEG